ncbi:hypothetical protein KBD20_00860 [Candidatus Saccharibacteria bacterium]|nr:hypothetical protein [Candidatus Saccharibacteria bacterium]
MKKYPFHEWLAMPKESKTWHEDDIADEFSELQEAKGLINKWSELSDVVYTVDRARWSGHTFDYPIPGHTVAIGYLYMYPKYTMRFLFFRRAGKKLDPISDIRQVRNPKKVHKLHHIAKKHNLDPKKFEEICTKQYRHWRFVLPK